MSQHKWIISIIVGVKISLLSSLGLWIVLNKILSLKDIGLIFVKLRMQHYKNHVDAFQR